METAVSITTINVPKVIECVEQNRIKFGHKPVLYVVTGDKKTPVGVQEYCDSINDQYESRALYLNTKEQDDILTSESVRFYSWFPYNCVGRRNIGDLYAVKYTGAKRVIRLDDDNFPHEDFDFFGSHLICGDKFHTLPRMIDSNTGWYNICADLLSLPEVEFYARGFPLKERFKKIVTKERRNVSARVAINTGLWFGEPDIDAITRLMYPDLTTCDLKIKGFALGRGTWSPINTQNTCIAAYLLPASFASPYADRYDDIFCGYVQRTLMDLIGDFSCYGQPIVIQSRNLHNIFSDLDAERRGYEWTDGFCKVLRAFQPVKPLRGYVHGMKMLLEYLEKELPVTMPKFWEWFKDSWIGMQLWVDIFKDGEQAEQSEQSETVKE